MWESTFLNIPVNFIVMRDFQTTNIQSKSEYVTDLSEYKTEHSVTASKHLQLWF